MTNLITNGTDIFRNTVAEMLSTCQPFRLIDSQLQASSGVQIPVCHHHFVSVIVLIYMLYAVLYSNNFYKLLQII